MIDLANILDDKEVRSGRRMVVLKSVRKWPAPRAGRP